MSSTATEPSVEEMESYLLQQLNWRYATKKFDPGKKLSSEQLAKLQEAVRLAPSSYGLQPYRVFLISDPQVREKVARGGMGAGAGDRCVADRGLRLKDGDDGAGHR